MIKESQRELKLLLGQSCSLIGVLNEEVWGEMNTFLFNFAGDSLGPPRGPSAAPSVTEPLLSSTK